MFIPCITHAQERYTLSFSPHGNHTMRALSMKPKPINGIPAANAIMLSPEAVSSTGCSRAAEGLSSRWRSSARRSSFLCRVGAHT